MKRTLFRSTLKSEIEISRLQLLEDVAASNLGNRLHLAKQSPIARKLTPTCRFINKTELVGQCLGVGHSVFHTLLQHGCALGADMAQLYHQLREMQSDIPVGDSP